MQIEKLKKIESTDIEYKECMNTAKGCCTMTQQRGDLSYVVECSISSGLFPYNNSVSYCNNAKDNEMKSV